MNDLVKLLPIGTICKLKKSKYLLMIVGYCSYDRKFEEMYLYKGIVYPAGLLNFDVLYRFNKSDIVDVVYNGYRDDRFNLFEIGINLGLKDRKIKIDERSE